MLTRLLLVLALAWGGLWGQGTPPALTRHVTDPQGFLPVAAHHEIALALQALERDVPCQAIVWIGDLPAGESREDFAARVFKAWGIGDKVRKDGVAIFVFPAQRGLRIEVGYGLEDRLTDAEAGRILRERMTPRLRAGDRVGAVMAGVDGIRASLLKGVEKPAPIPPRAHSPAPRESWDLDWLAFLLYAVPVLLGLWAIRRFWYGPYYYYDHGSRWDWGSSSSSDSRSWGGSGSSGGSDSGGSFDSFSGGGGDSGGGGASGDW